MNRWRDELLMAFVAGGCFGFLIGILFIVLMRLFCS